MEVGSLVVTTFVDGKEIEKFIGKLFIKVELVQKPVYS